jgi:hypothetical protein
VRPRRDGGASRASIQPGGFGTCAGPSALPQLLMERLRIAVANALAG